MNNIQLAILLEGYRRNFENIANELFDELPRNLQATTENIIGQKRQYFPILVPLYDAIAEMGNDIELLKKEEGD